MLDIESLDSMRAVNTKAMNLVESLKPYQKLMALAPQMLLLHATHASRFISVRHLHATLFNQKCLACGSYEHYLFLFTGDRCYFWCLYNDARFSMMTLTSAASEFKVSKNLLRDSCNVIHSIHGVYQPPKLFFDPGLPPDTIGPNVPSLSAQSKP